MPRRGYRSGMKYPMKSEYTRKGKPRRTTRRLTAEQKRKRDLIMKDTITAVIKEDLKGYSEDYIRKLVRPYYIPGLKKLLPESKIRAMALKSQGLPITMRGSGRKKQRGSRRVFDRVNEMDWSGTRGNKRFRINGQANVNDYVSKVEDTLELQVGTNQNGGAFISAKKADAGGYDVAPALLTMYEASRLAGQPEPLAEDDIAKCGWSLKFIGYTKGLTVDTLAVSQWKGWDTMHTMPCINVRAHNNLFDENRFAEGDRYVAVSMTQDGRVAALDKIDYTGTQLHAKRIADLTAAYKLYRQSEDIDMATAYHANFMIQPSKYQFFAPLSIADGTFNEDWTRQAYEGLKCRIKDARINFKYQNGTAALGKLAMWVIPADEQGSVPIFTNGTVPGPMQMVELPNVIRPGSAGVMRATDSVCITQTGSTPQTILYQQVFNLNEAYRQQAQMETYVNNRGGRVIEFASRPGGRGVWVGDQKTFNDKIDLSVQCSSLVPTKWFQYASESIESMRNNWDKWAGGCVCFCWMPNMDVYVEDNKYHIAYIEEFGKSIRVSTQVHGEIRTDGAPKNKAYAQDAVD